MTYGVKRDYRKIDIYVARNYIHEDPWLYACSTTWAASLAQAKAKYLEQHPGLCSNAVRVQFSN